MPTHRRSTECTTPEDVSPHGSASTASRGSGDASALEGGTTRHGTEALPPDSVSDPQQQRQQQWQQQPEQQQQQQPQREAQPPILGWPPLTFPSGNRIGNYDEVIEVRNSLRLQRRMRRRGLRPDAHLPRGYRLDPTVWDRAGRRYGSWLAGQPLSEQDSEGLNSFLSIVLAPATIFGPHVGVLSANEEYCDGELTSLALGHVVEARVAALRGREGGLSRP